MTIFRMWKYNRPGNSFGFFGRWGKRGKARMSGQMQDPPQIGDRIETSANGDFIVTAAQYPPDDPTQFILEVKYENT